MPRARARPAWQHDSDPWLTKQEAIAYTGRSARTIERAVARGELGAGGTRGKRAFRRSALDAWLAMGVVIVIVLIALIASCGLVLAVARDRDRSARIEVVLDARQDRSHDARNSDGARRLQTPRSDRRTSHRRDKSERSGVSSPIGHSPRRA